MVAFSHGSLNAVQYGHLSRLLLKSADTPPPGAGPPPMGRRAGRVYGNALRRSKVFVVPRGACAKLGGEGKRSLHTISNAALPRFNPWWARPDHHRCFPLVTIFTTQNQHTVHLFTLPKKVIVLICEVCPPSFCKEEQQTVLDWNKRLPSSFWQFCQICFWL